MRACKTSIFIPLKSCKTKNWGVLHSLLRVCHGQGISGSHTSEDQRFYNWHFSLFEDEDTLKSPLAHVRCFTLVCSDPASFPLNYCNLKQLESIYLSANNEIPDAMVWKCMWAGSFPRGCSDVHEGNCNVPQDSVWLCDTRMHLRCSLETANKQPLLHIFNFRVMWIHLVPSIQARRRLRWTSGTK